MFGADLRLVVCNLQTAASTQSLLAEALDVI